VRKQLVVERWNLSHAISYSKSTVAQPKTAADDLKDAAQPYRKSLMRFATVLHHRQPSLNNDWPAIYLRRPRSATHRQLAPPAERGPLRTDCAKDPN
jgi:hypothetical protein